MFLAVLHVAEQTDSSAFGLVDGSFENCFLQNEKTQLNSQNMPLPFIAQLIALVKLSPFALCVYHAPTCFDTQKKLYLWLQGFGVFAAVCAFRKTVHEIIHLLI